ncbi:MAG TPA: hypothetical protein VF221_04775, partial [Chloroflexota bacterium]
MARYSLTGVFCAVAAVVVSLATVAAHADTYSDVVATLTQGDVYVAKALPAYAHMAPGDIARLRVATNAAANQGVTEKIAIVSSYPPHYAHASQAAEGLRNFLDLSGVLVLVSPRGIGVASDNLTQDQIRSIEARTRPRCLASSYTSCAIFAGQLAVAQVKSDVASANRSAQIFWVIV